MCVLLRRKDRVLELKFVSVVELFRLLPNTKRCESSRKECRKRLDTSSELGKRLLTIKIKMKTLYAEGIEAGGS